MNRVRLVRLACSGLVTVALGMLLAGLPMPGAGTPWMGPKGSVAMAQHDLGEEQEEMERLQQWVYHQGGNYTVAANWVTRLSPEEREALCGDRAIEAPDGPLPENMGFFSGVGALETQGLEQPSSYDAMALGHVTPVKRQGTCGSCWMFAAVADLESTVAICEDSLPDFSEQEVGDCNIWSAVGGYNFCQGGNPLVAINHLTQYGGADETCHPYAATPQACSGCPILKNVDNWRWITFNDGETQIAAIKNAILNYGPVYSSMYSSDPGFHAYETGVYEYWGQEPHDHAIQIIGWDDTLQHSRGSGAWMIRNSWGTDWGAGGPYPGCAWVAYGAANLGDFTSVITGYTEPHDTIFYHDECGWMGWSSGFGTPTAYGAVRFTPTQESLLTAVDFWAVDAGMSYEIKIFDTLTELGGGIYSFSDQLGSAQAGATAEPGYYSIPLETSVPLIRGHDFTVQVRLTTSTPEHFWPIPIDYSTVPWLPPWTSIATFSGESYVSGDGEQFAKPSVYNPSHYVGYVDVGLRARAVTEEIGQPQITVEPTSFEVTLSANTTQNYTLTITNVGGANLSYNISDGECPWLSESPTSGWVAPGGSDTVTVTVNTTGLAPGTHYAAIVIANNDPSANTRIVQMTLHVTGVLSVITTELPDGTTGLPYQVVLQATGGTLPYTWAITDGDLPDDLELDGDTGLISGMPTDVGTFNFTVKVTDDEDLTATRVLSITVGAVEHVEFVYDLKAGWNMISLPIHTAETSPGMLFPDHVAIYAWNAVHLTYSVPAELVPGQGYWILYFSDTTVPMEGVPVMRYELLDAAAGWHMIGSLAVDAQITVTDGDVYFPFYSWNPQIMTYEATSTLKPGRGYWLLGFTVFSIVVEPVPSEQAWQS